MKTIRVVLVLATLAPFLLLGGRANAITLNIEMLDFRYKPALQKINLGDSVSWTNNGDETHTATTRPSVPGGFSTTVEPGNTSSPEGFFDSVGKYPYFCEFHPEMKGAIGVLIDVDANSKPLFQPFTLTWSPFPGGSLSWDIQVKDPGSDRFVTLVRDTHDNEMTFGPTRRGKYQLRGRTQKNVSDEGSAYSPPVTITVL
jgi:plastocyanin